MDILAPFVFLLVILMAMLPASFAVQCYVCSWSPKDDINRTDICSSGNFEPNAAYIHECEIGCEIYIQWDKNGVLEQWRKNCLQSEKQLTGECKSEENIAYTWKHCTCSVDLCNSASVNYGFLFIYIPITFLILTLMI